MRERWSREYAERLLGEWERSGVPIGEYAHGRNLPLARLHYWKATLARDASKRKRLPSEPRFAPVVIREKVKEIAMAAPKIDPKWLGAFLRALLATDAE